MNCRWLWFSFIPTNCGRPHKNAFQFPSISTEMNLNRQLALSGFGKSSKLKIHHEAKDPRRKQRLKQKLMKQFSVDFPLAALNKLKENFPIQISSSSWCLMMFDKQIVAAHGRCFSVHLWALFILASLIEIFTICKRAKLEGNSSKKRCKVLLIRKRSSSR